MELLFLCLKVFVARVTDVTLGTTRTILVVKGKKLYATMIAFIEVFIWFVVVKEALNTDSNSLWIAFSYAAGFASGTYLGMVISNAFIPGFVGVQVISNKVSDEMIKTIRDNGFAVSIINLHKTIENDSDKKMLYIQINKNKQDNLVTLLKELDESAFIVVNDTKYLQNGFIK